MPDTALKRFLEEPAILVEITAVKGSAPREAGTFMLVSKRGIWETIGGGQFEYMARGDHSAHGFEMVYRRLQSPVL